MVLHVAVKIKDSYSYKCLHTSEKPVCDDCTKGWEKYPDDTKLKDYASKAYLKKGLEYYKAGNKIKKAANDSGLNESNPEQFNAEYAKADVQFNEALPFMIKSYEYNNKNDKTLKALKNIYTSLKMDDKASDAKAKLEAL